MRIGTVAFAFALSAISRLAAAGTCPLSFIQHDPQSIIFEYRATSAPRDSMSGYTQNCVQGCNLITSTATFDLQKGSFFCTAYATNHSTAEAAVSLHDVYTLIGPGGGGPITFISRAHCFGNIGGPNSSSSATIREGATNQKSDSWHIFQENRYSDLDLSITRSAGQTFDLSLSGEGIGNNPANGGAGGGAVSMQLLFPNLPLGYSVVSCQGFTTEQVVPTSRTTWGRMKTMYR